MAKILIADDQLVMRNMFKSILAPLDHELVLAENGKLAYNAAMAQRYDMVLTDLYMPELNGIQLTEKLRQSKNYLSVPIFIVSTESATKQKDAGKNAGATGWIVKPITADKLLPSLEKFLN